MEPKRRNTLIILAVAMVVMMGINYLLVNSLFTGGRRVQETTYNAFLQEIERKNINTAQVEADVIYYTLKTQPAESQETAKQETWLERITAAPSSDYYVTVAMQDASLVEKLYAAGATFSMVRPKEPSPLLNILFSVVLPMALFFFVGQMLMRRMNGAMGGNVMSFGKSNAKIYVKANDGVKFSDVAGEDEAKEALTEIVDFLHDPTKYQRIGAKMPKGALLVGPPGTGKTLLAKAVAGEASVPFFSISGSEFVEMFVGMGAAKVRDLFKQAAEKAPCIVFIDEIDTIGKKRDAQGLTGNDEREQTLNQLLTEMDGFDASKGVVILGACNRPEILDPALLRPGRFDRRIPVELPDLQGRKEILEVHAKKVKLAPGIDFGVIARMASGASGADLANLINEAALHAVRMRREEVTQEDLEESVETVLAGYKRKNQILSEKEKHIVAYHEVGHALAATLLNDSAPVTKITIVPRTSGALGYTLQVDEDEPTLISREALESKIVTLVAGRVAEEIVFGQKTTGASNDIEKVTKMARAMIARFGMSEDIGMVALEQNTNMYLGGDAALACSNALAEDIDRKVIALVGEMHRRATQLLSDHRTELDYLAKALFEKEVLSGEEFHQLMKEAQV